ncbi:MAG: 3-isopropylmalate dehydratase small subunit [Candidatus Bathyarchaeia archaeon]
MKIRGKVIKYGDDVNTDVIIPSRYLVLIDPHELAKYAMAGLDKDFAKKVVDRQIIVVGRNFGCGSSREQAPVSLKYAGVKCVVAESFARIFYRNAINIGLPVLECPRVSSTIQDGDEVSIDLEKGTLNDLTNGAELKGLPTPEFLLKIMEKGLVEYVKEMKR